MAKQPFEWALEGYLRMMALVMSLQIMMALLQQFYVYSPAFMSGFTVLGGGLFGPFMGNMMYMLMFMPMVAMLQLLPMMFRGFYWW